MGAGDDIVGFNPTDADAILRMLSSIGGESIPRSRHPITSLMLGVTKTGGLAAGAEGSVWLSDPTASGWTTSSASCPAWTVSSTIAAGSSVLLVPVNGRWLALEVC